MEWIRIGWYFIYNNGRRDKFSVYNNIYKTYMVTTKQGYPGATWRNQIKIST